jgi:hypothetical protein
MLLSSYANDHVLIVLYMLHVRAILMQLSMLLIVLYMLHVYATNRAMGCYLIFTATVYEYPPRNIQMQ